MESAKFTVNMKSIQILSSDRGPVPEQLKAQRLVKLGVHSDGLSASVSPEPGNRSGCSA